ncbi:response regulator transcription factor [Methyloligella sp. 2.7D]|uniref:response regulator transcription factor n=1 Tax=unclassified Methyloligella TaxID=2625955 RepID=UPI00157CA1D0|nr:response regulator transcription factor [Methyloligella sp. GL2]QKP78881.1 response regulator transcription factor [Methyloligella sp. GL2]
MHILIVEDDSRIAADIEATLNASGFTSEIVGDGEEAWFRGDTGSYDAIILDLGLPKMDGLAVLKRWRAAKRQTPVLILTARGAWPERVEGIEAGADDYLPKPFRMEELLARLRALIRRASGHGAAIIEAGELTLDTLQMRLSKNGVPVSLSPLEYRLISYLLHHQGRVVPAGEIIEHLYGDDDARDANALEAVIARLRKKLGPESIETRRGFGYAVPGDDG